MQKVSSLHVHQRPIEPMDHGLIYNSLLKSYQQQGYGAEGLDKELFFANHKKQVEKILSSCYGICAVSPGDHDLIYAYILFDLPRDTLEAKPIMHYVYVKTAFRKMGFATWLIDSMMRSCGSGPMPITITHRTKAFQRFVEPKGDFVFNPYILGELHGSSQTEKR